jgi:hypothetical protein
VGVADAKLTQVDDAILIREGKNLDKNTALLFTLDLFLGKEP